MTTGILFPLLLAAGLALAFFSKNSSGAIKGVLIVISVLLIGIGGYGLFTSFF